MQKCLTLKAFLLFTLFFILIAVTSFAAFHKTEQVCSAAQACLKQVAPAKGGDLIWEVVSRQFLSLLSI